MLNFNNISKIYFVGIGGISMSALAKLALINKKEVSGCDDTPTKLTQKLKSLGIKFRKHIYKKELKSCDLVVYTNAIRSDNENLVLAKKLNKTIIERAEFLGEISKTYKTVIAVAGTHGKTTTTSMLAHVLKGLNPTVHVGGIIKEFDSNLKVGSKELFITEACEYNKSFLYLNPDYLIITNIEKDHMDCYKNFCELKQTFAKLISKTQNIVAINQKYLSFFNQIFANTKFLTFSLSKNSNYYATCLTQKNGCYSFNVQKNNETIGKINLQIPGMHNVLNALGTIAFAENFGISFKKIKQGLETFVNVKRRFEILYQKEITVISDYAHHPTEIQATIKTAQELKHNNLVCVFQPHTYSRTLSLFKEFLGCFKECDKLILLKTYAAREKEINGGKAIDLYNELSKNQNTSYFEDKDSLFTHLKNSLEKNDIILFMGAGTIDNYAREFSKNITKIDFFY